MNDWIAVITLVASTTIVFILAWDFISEAPKSMKKAAIISLIIMMLFIIFVMATK